MRFKPQKSGPDTRCLLVGGLTEQDARYVFTLARQQHPNARLELGHDRVVMLVANDQEIRMCGKLKGFCRGVASASKVRPGHEPVYHREGSCRLCGELHPKAPDSDPTAYC